ncbi:MAG: helix-turn-helix domain-containing protein [Novosphingobium sp.]|nr:helix-turn-helix domain-containing protein [Novosphingobium sp.]
MPIAAHFEPAPQSDDPRRSARHTLRLEALGATTHGERTRVTVHNISSGGLLFETATVLDIGNTIALELPEAGERLATVSWASEAYYGCQFAQPLSAAELSAAQLRGVATKGGRVPSPALTVLDDDFGHRLQRMRKLRGLTLAQIAERLGVSKPTVWAWEQGRSRPVGNRIDPLAEVLGVTRSELYPEASALTPLHDLLSRVRAEIAAAAGTLPEKIKIMIEL